MNALLLNSQLALGRALVLDPILELLAKLGLRDADAAQLERKRLGLKERSDLHREEAVRGGRGGEPEVMVDWANQLPANDAVANSMYGGAQEIFQQQDMTIVAPVAAPQVPAGAPPLPEGGLPPGWTMEQWAYYGHQYQQ